VPWEQAVVYELHVGTFTPEGTFSEARRRLKALADLGVTRDRADAGCGFSRAAQLGLRRRAALCTDPRMVARTT
jgi:hypothetical protein